ncbi:PQQ-dependent sugar dehydrogenase [Paenibacillus sp. DMB20]|uniref:PQQ-dependent sugar dehydrogenase n=1 Tax=Paenibacillus sp. DMB20 TaxID=1642570 RepID=UPI00069A1CF8|nr:PQQ-dependent sugar dehydrogenase [Paenibacillus sp. DMB20]
MAIGPDLHLYITTGDAGNGELAQAESSLGGKILRMKLDGKVPEDNPVSGSYVYSTGHRNAQGLAWNDAGQLYNSEHGPSGTPGGHDEINHIEAGNDYGWLGIIGDQAGKGLTTPAYHTGREDDRANRGSAENPRRRMTDYCFWNRAVILDINSYRNSWNCAAHVLTNDLPLNIINIYFTL